MPGTASFKCVRRFLLAVLDVLLNGTANIPTSLKKSNNQSSTRYDLSKNLAKSAIRGSIRSFCDSSVTSSQSFPEGGANGSSPSSA
jgi:hypothetical protein